ncbi:ribose-phosphate diphosphokinase [Aliiroseovarius sp.]|uniref:ribose-phosphate diphosphokinase n=1 Tax=Aliiroseovarius sp. TaxID=1872442 RepID=UPI0026258369|nr:ribose-phosphate diphosphokinase [Aliiroseovarius sp.]
MKPVILAFPDMRPLAADLAPLLGAEQLDLAWRHFPDGESLVTLPPDLAGREVIFLATLRDPDRLALPLRFAAETARAFGAQSVGLIAPYLGYMRQDKRFHPGEALSAPLFSAFLGESFDWLATVDPHLHRNPDLSRLFAIPAAHAAAAPVIADWIGKNIPDAVLFGPDSESQQWVAEVARLAQRPYEVLQKIRRGDRAVEVSLPDSDTLRGGTPVILDDIASSGQTMVRTLQHLDALGANAAVCVVIHAVFAGSAYEDILAAGAARIVSTNTITHDSNEISVAPLLADVARKTGRIT